MVGTYTLATYLVLLISERVHPKILIWFESVWSAHHQETKNKTRKQKNKMKQKTIKRTSHPHAQNKIIANIPLCPALEVMIFEFGQTLWDKLWWCWVHVTSTSKKQKELCHHLLVQWTGVSLVNKGCVTMWPCHLH